MLERNTHNRLISPQKVAEWVATLKEGRWLLTSQGVAFAEPGFLSDGQHRLTSIQRAGVSAKMQVTFGEDPEAHKVLDTGKKRTPGDAASIVGIKMANQQAAAAKVILEVESGRAHSPSALANDVIVQEILDRSPDILDAVHAAAPIYRPTKASPAGLAAGIYFIRRLHPADVAAPFLDGVATGLGFERKHDPRLTLRNTLIRREYVAKHPAHRSFAVAAYVIKSWNKWRSGQTLKQLGWRPDEPFPLVR